MPRPLRIEVPGGVYHVYSRGNRKEPIALTDSDRHRFVGLLHEIVVRYGWYCLSYCLIDNHFHLLVETPTPNLALGMQRLKGTYGRRFNDEYGLTGHVFQGRFASKLVLEESYRLEVARYIALNPVEAGLVRLPEDYPWSSYAATIGLVSPPPFLAVDRLLEPYGSGWPARARFKAFVEDGLPRNQADWDTTWGQTPAVAVAAR